MTAATLTLTDFLLARIAEEEGAAGAKWVDAPDRHLDAVSNCDCDYDHLVETYLAADPAHVLAECEAKRRIVTDARPFRDLCGNDDWFGGASRIHGDVLRLLAAVYAEHPDYRDEWKP